MKKALRLLLLLACILPAYFSNAQAHLKLRLASQLPGSIDTGQSFVINVEVINLDTTQFIDELNFGYYAIPGGPHQQNSNPGSGFSYQVKTDTIPGNDTIIKILTGHVTQPAFYTGPSVVVIWPIATNTTIDIDTFRFDLPISISLHEVDDKKMFMVIADNELQIFIQDDIRLKQLRIYDAIGHEVLNKLNPSATTPLPPMNTGLYFAEVTYNNNQRRVFRFYH